MPGPNVGSVFADFNHHVRQSSLLLESARARGIPFFQLEQIAELSFLRLHLAWERFLEESFARYMCGARSITGFRPRCYATPRNLEHARRFLMMGLQRIPRYADWAKRELVIWRANTVFKDGRPFASPLRAGARDLDDMATIRNCIAHSSEYARQQFQKLVHRRVGVAYTFGAGRFLLRRTPNAADNFLSFFSARILLVAEQIVR